MQRKVDTVVATALPIAAPAAAVPRHGLAAAALEQPRAGDETARLVALDGLRGVLALMVMIGHYFGEVPHGVRAVTFAWVAVKMFFVLSGFLMARIILERLHCANFFAVFYIRRACRTLPVYLVTLALVFCAAALFRDRAWMEADKIFPLWSFLTFTQGFVIVATGSLGSDWLIPTWTLTVEEQFYLVAPAICVLVPRRHLVGALLALVVGSLVFRTIALTTSLLPAQAGLVLLPAIVHAMLFGMIVALWLDASARGEAAPITPRIDLGLRIAPIAILVVVFSLKLVDGGGLGLFEIVGVPLVALAGAAYLAAIVREAPEAARFKSPTLGLLGRLSYSIYLLHMPILGLLHGVLLGARPDIASPGQIMVTVLALAVTIGFAWLVNVMIEAPMIAYGRSWRWQDGARRA